MSVLGFEGEWFDHVSGLLQKIYVKYFLDNNTIELLTDKTAFLKQIFYPDVTLHDLYIGNTITVYNRLIVLKKYANTATEAYMKSREVRFLCVARSSNLTKTVPSALLLAKKFNLRTGRVITISNEFYGEKISASSGDSLLEIVGLSSTTKENFLSEANKLGPSFSAVDASADTITQIFRELKSVQVPPNSSLLLIKPHSVKSFAAGEILRTLSEQGFSFRGFYSIHLTLPYAEELFDSYRNIYSNYSAVIEHLCSSASLAVIVVGPGYDIVSQLREIVGPLDPQLAKAIRPKSIRALYGESLIKNAVHCTDLPEDGEIECKYFFESLANL